MTINELKADYTPDQKAQEAVWVHGCSLKQVGLIKGIIASGRQSEICVTKITDPRHFQNFGILVKGRVTLMATRDIGSKYNPETGERVLFLGAKPEAYAKVLTTSYDELVNPDGSYTESFLVPEEIVGVYACDYFMRRADEFDIEDLEEMKKAAGVDTITVLKTSVK